MLRVLGTIQNSAYAGAMKSETNDLASWVSEIHAGMYAHQVRLRRRVSLLPSR